MSEPVYEKVQTFTLSEDGYAITCKRCKITSHNHNDVENHYCGNCKVYHDDLWPPARQAWIDGLDRDALPELSARVVRHAAEHLEKVIGVEMEKLGLKHPEHASELMFLVIVAAPTNKTASAVGAFHNVETRIAKLMAVSFLTQVKDVA